MKRGVSCFEEAALFVFTKNEVGGYIIRTFFTYNRYKSKRLFPAFHFEGLRSCFSQVVLSHCPIIPRKRSEPPVSGNIEKPRILPILGFSWPICPFRQSKNLFLFFVQNFINQAVLLGIVSSHKVIAICIALNNV